MACNLSDLVRIQKLIESNALAESPKIMELGSNDLNVVSEADVVLANEIIQKLTKGKGSQFRVPNIPTAVPARQFYDCLGWEYYCLDVDQRPGTLHIDLNSGGFDARYKGYFDVVTNHGTTEHVINPIASFFAVHELTKPGGIMIHDTPLFGMGNHGFVDLTPKFWHTMIFFNEYEVIESSVRAVDPKLIDSANFYLPHLSFIEGLSEVAYHGAIINIVLKRNKNLTYLPPLDMWPGMSGTVLANMLFEATKLYLQTDLVNVKELLKTINWFLERNLMSQRMTESFLGAKLPGLARKLSRSRPAFHFTSVQGRDTI